MFKRTQRGFTLIELVVVIVILGILAAFALPRFMGLEKQARIASLRALEGSLRSSAAMAHAQWLAQGSPASILIDGTATPIVITRGYPNTATIDDTLDPSSIDNVNNTPGRFTYNGTGRFTLIGRSTNSGTNCTVTYASPPAAPAGSPPTITVVNPTGC